MKKELTKQQHQALMEILKLRFEKNSKRHEDMEWEAVRKRLEENPQKLWSLNQMEITGGEPDVVGIDKHTGSFLFYDCSAESPKGRRSICYDRKALDARKENKPANNAVDMADSMGIAILDETQYRGLQELGNFDTKSSSWIATPPAIRSLGGALFCDRRYDHVFVYHNGADSYYAARGFRGVLEV